ncbi:MAG: bacterial Ig-like domain-containing protein [Lachnospiraceae bacterium]|nr:bacterial Ig-like domain-containing protein [Lachnospiraceae bacterium]
MKRKLALLLAWTLILNMLPMQVAASGSASEATAELTATPWPTPEPTATPWPTPEPTATPEPGAPSRTTTIDGELYYQISLPDELKFISESGGHWLCENYILMNDIVLNEQELSCDENGNLTVDTSGLYRWTPIGNSNNRFSGRFDGNGHTISGVYVDSSNNYAGFFGYSTGTISNLGIINSYIKGNQYVGGVAGYIRNGIINNCYNMGITTGNYSVGGITGASYYSSSVIKNCYNTGSVRGKTYVGGIVGEAYYASITNSCNIGHVTCSSGTYDGAVVGYISSGTVKNCCYLKSVFVNSNLYGIGNAQDSDGVVSPKGSSYFCFNEDNTLNLPTHKYKIAGSYIRCEKCGMESVPKSLTAMTLPEKRFYVQNQENLNVDGGTLEVVFEDGSKNTVLMTADTISGFDNTKLGEQTLTITCGEYSAEFSVIVICAPNQTVIKDGWTYYQVFSREELIYISETGGEWLSRNYVLMNDIVLNEQEFTCDANGNLTIDTSELYEWTPIGNYNNRFSGRFDGNGHTISGVYIDSLDDYVGFFGYSNGTISNLGIVNSYAKGSQYVGGVAGYTGYYRTIDNCYNEGDIHGSSHVGGVVGYASNYSTIDNCHNEGSIHGNSYVGGIVGYAYYYSTLDNCYNMGSIHGGSNTGGIVGRTYYSTITNSCDLGNVTGSGSYVGAVIGNRNYGTVKNCYYLKNNAINSSVSGIGSTQDADGVVSSKEESYFCINDDNTLNMPTHKYQNEDGYLKCEGCGVKKTPKTVTVKTLPQKCAYVQNQEELNVDGGTLEVAFADGSTGTVTMSEEMISGFDKTKVGRQTLTVTCGGQTARFSVYVVCAPKLTVTMYGATYHLISSAEELIYMSVVGGEWLNKNYILTKDIVINSEEFIYDESGALAIDTGRLYQWSPIGKEYSNPFWGQFNGNGHTISGVYIDSQNNYEGLFGYSRGAIRNIGVVNSYIKGTNYVGGIAGYASSGTITGSCYLGSVRGTGSYVGAVAGYGTSGIANNCYYLQTDTINTTLSGVGNLKQENGSASPVADDSIICIGENKTSDWILHKYHSENGSIRCEDCGKETVITQMSIKSLPKRVFALNQEELSVIGGAIEVVYGDGIKSAIPMTKGMISGFNNTKAGTQTLKVTYGDRTVEFTVCILGRTIHDGVTYFEISSSDELKFVAETGGECLTQNYILTKDIVLNSQELTYDENGNLTVDTGGLYEWTPIGKDYNSSFRGIFNGNGHTISGVYVDSSNSYAGFIGYSRGTVRNLGIVNSYIKGSSNVGGIVGYSTSGTVDNCYHMGSVYGNQGVGGIAGEISSYSILSNCYNTGFVRGSSYIGGIVGGLYYGSTVRNSCNLGKVTGSGSYVGAIVGYRYYYSSKVEGCYYLKNNAVNSALYGIANTSDVDGVVMSAEDVFFCINDDGSLNLISHEYEATNGIVKCKGCGKEGVPKEITIKSLPRKTLYAQNTEELNVDGGVLEVALDDGLMGTIPMSEDMVSNFDNSKIGERTLTVSFGTCTAKYTIYVLGTVAMEGTTYFNISSAEELKYVTKAGVECLNRNYVLTNDIVLNSQELICDEDGNLTVDTGGLYEWTPIGDQNNHFTGIFEGNGHTISGLYVDRQDDYAGFLGYNAGTVSNLGIINSYLKGENFVGGIASYANAGTIDNCYSTGTICGGSNVGGIVGYAYSCLVDNCYTAGNVKGDSRVGGIAGYAISNTIKNSCTIGNVVGTSANTGAIVGYQSLGTAHNCYYLKTDTVNKDIAGVGMLIDEETSVLAEEQSFFCFGEDGVLNLVSHKYQDDGIYLECQLCGRKSRPEEISVKKAPNKLVYIMNQDELSTEGGLVEITFEDGARHTIDMTEEMVSGFDNTKAGEQTITITFGAKTTSYTVIVEDPTPTPTPAPTATPVPTTAPTATPIPGSAVELEIKNSSSATVPATIKAPIGGWVAGDNTFTVACESPCLVAVSYDGGLTYKRLAATAGSTGYSFTAEDVTSDTIIAIGYVGDINGDGTISNSDATRLAAIYAGKTDPTNALMGLICDVNNDGTVSNSDVTGLRAAYAGKRQLTW